MDSDSWISVRLSNSSRRYHSRSDLYFDAHATADFRAEFLCPFCSEDFDVVGLCCHLNEDHPLQAKNGVCPVCGKKVGMDLVGHVTMQHGNFLKVQRKRRVRKGGFGSTFSILKKELREGALQSLLGGSSYTVSTNSDPDPLLSSFIFNPVVADESAGAQPLPLDEGAFIKESSKDDFLKRKPRQLRLSDKDQAEKARRFDFVQGLLMSTILDDDL